MVPPELTPDAPLSQTDNSHPNSATQTEAVSPNRTPDSSWAPDHGRQVTLEEYWEKWYENPYPDLDVSYEWNNGILEAKPLHNARQIGLCNWFLTLLHRYVETFDHTSLINLDTGFILKIEDESDPSGERVQVSLVPKTGPQAKVYNRARHQACGGTERWSRNDGGTRRSSSFGLRWKRLKAARR